MAIATTTTTLPGLVTADTASALTTAWTAPASCLDPTITVAAGSCEYGQCTWRPDFDITTQQGAVNFPLMTGPWLFTSTSCVPPGYRQDQYYFTGQGCPSGYVTASTAGVDDTSTEMSIVCCPR